MGKQLEIPAAVEAIAMEAFAVEGEDLAQVTSLGKRNQRRVGQVHGVVVVAGPLPATNGPSHEGGF